MVPNIGRIMQELLKMTNEVELDALTNTTRSLVAEFAEEVVPFAVELSEQLMATYVRLIRETLESRTREAEAGTLYDELGGEEKTLVCMNILKTIDQLVGSLEKSPVSLAKVEETVLPGLELTIRHNLLGRLLLSSHRLHRCSFYLFHRQSYTMRRLRYLIHFYSVRN